VTPKGQTRDANTLTVQYLKNGWRYRLRSKGSPIGNDIWGIKCLRDRWRSVTPKVLESVWSAILETAWLLVFVLTHTGSWQMDGQTNTFLSQRPALA